MNLSLTITETVTAQPTWPEMMERLWLEKHTGPVVVHFQSGQPRAVELVTSERISLDLPVRVRA